MMTPTALTEPKICPILVIVFVREILLFDRVDGRSVDTLASRSEK